jgi:hypothetical protein
VSGNSSVGGLAGYNNATVSNSFWDTETSGQSSSDGGTGKTTAEMKNVDTFTDLSTVGLDSTWDFVGNPNDDTGNDDYWDIDGTTNDGYPYLIADQPYIYLQVAYRDGSPCDFPTELDVARAIDRNAKSDTVKWGDSELSAYRDLIRIDYGTLGWSDGDSIDITVRSTPSGDTVGQSNSYSGIISGTGSQNWSFGSGDGLTLPVVLSSFTVQFTDNKPTLNWTTETECDNLGWYIYRSETDKFNESKQINKDMIEGAGSISTRRDYVFTDEEVIEAETTYWYWIESVSYGGVREQYGPRSITVEVENDNDRLEIPVRYGLSQNYKLISQYYTTYSLFALSVILLKR